MVGWWGGGGGRVVVVVGGGGGVVVGLYLRGISNITAIGGTFLPKIILTFTCGDRLQTRLNKLTPCDHINTLPKALKWRWGWGKHWGGGGPPGMICVCLENLQMSARTVKGLAGTGYVCDALLLRRLVGRGGGLHLPFYDRIWHFFYCMALL